MIEWKLAPAASPMTQAETAPAGDVLHVRAVIASLDEVDHDGDTYARGAVTVPNNVVISAWNHGAMAGAMPAGQGSIAEEGATAVLTGEIWTDTAAGRDVAAMLRRRGTAQQWSYGFKVLDARPVERAGRKVRQITRLEPYEASPVWRAAGVGTQTLDVRSAGRDELGYADVLHQARAHVDDIQARELLLRSAARLIATER